MLNTNVLHLLASLPSYDGVEIHHPSKTSTTNRIHKQQHPSIRLKLSDRLARAWDRNLLCIP